MSSAILEILDKDLNDVGFGEYHGTSDTVPSAFVTNYSEIEGQKPYFLGWNECKNKNHNHIDVILFSNYGGGFYWPSKVCVKCKAITGITSPHEPDWGYTMPTDEQTKPYRELHRQGYPKDGDPREGDKSSD